MKVFNTENDARNYLEKRVPKEEAVKKFDLTPLKERLFEIPNTISPGHYEFKGKNGLTISYDLKDVSDAAFDICYKVYRPYIGDEVEGSLKPIFKITNLNILSSNFSDGISDHKQNPFGAIFWMPYLKSPKSELTYDFAYIDRGHIFLIDTVGFMSTPLDLLSFFHEAGHIESISLKQLGEQTVRTTISSSGVKTEIMKKTAYDLQRERYANAWMLHRTKRLFEDLQIPQDLIQNYIHHSQLESYHQVGRKRLETDTGV